MNRQSATATTGVWPGRVAIECCESPGLLPLPGPSLKLASRHQYNLELVGTGAGAAFLYPSPTLTGFVDCQALFEKLFWPAPPWSGFGTSLGPLNSTLEAVCQ